MAVSFASDIMPTLKQYQGPMMWRLNITNYAEVKENVAMIWARISATDDNRMPPPPFPPLSQTYLDTFKAWMAGGCQP